MRKNPRKETSMSLLKPSQPKRTEKHSQPKGTEKMPKWKTLPCDAEVTLLVPVAVRDWWSELAELQDVTPCDVVLDALQVGMPAVTERIREAAKPVQHVHQVYGPGPSSEGDPAKIEAVNKIEDKANARLNAAQFEE